MPDSVRILVIDDSEDDRLLYRRTLQKSSDGHYEIDETDSGDDVLQMIAAHNPACVLLDYSLPGRNGLEVLKQIRSKHPFLAVVMMTGQGNEAVAVTAMQEGAQNYIAKSNITPESLQRVIRVAIEHCALTERIHGQRTSLEVFTRALAHDLKEPVRTIRSFLDLYLSHEKISDRGQTYLNYIQNAAERMSTLIDTVHFYTRLDGDEPKSSKDVCDMATVLENAKDNINVLIKERKAIITSDPLPMVHANQMQLLQVVQNLLCNAIRHCDGTPVIHVCAEEGVNQWLFRVSDNGPGIHHDDPQKVFEPFKKLARHKEQGLGLGLAICKKIIESHGGRIWYESGAEAGATFLFTLPRLTPQAAGAPATTLRERADNSGKLGTILLVEDNEADVELTRIMLLEEARLKCNFIVARDGGDALEKMQTEIDKNRKIDLILLDINMPGMDGFDLLRKMHTNEALQRIPVVMCTTSSYDKDMGTAELLGVAGYVTKPAELRKLKTIIDETNTVQLRREGDGYTLFRAA